MEAARQTWAQARERWDAASLRTRIGVLAGVGVLVAGGLLAYARGTDVERAVLFSDLAQADAAQIVEQLRSMNVDYELAANGSTILVPTDRVHETRLTLASEGLPRGGGVGFEIFDTARFGESDFSEQVQFRRALEGELARTLGHLAGVQSARVHLVLPERSLFAAEERSASASVALQLPPGWELRPEQVRGVTHLVASSVPGLTPEAVTVVDGDGRPLSDPGAEEDLAQGGADLRQRVERARSRAVQQLLDASLGAGVAVVRVSADVDMSTEERVEETYDPERVATRSFEVTEEREGVADATQGVPGAVSNLPGGAAAEDAAGASASGTRHERRNFEVTKMVRRNVRPVGAVSRLTVAVVVDGHWTGEGADAEFEPRDAEELARIRALVSSAAGIHEDRGDRVTVECVPFARSRAETPDVTVDVLATYEPYFPYALGGLGLLALLVLALVAWRRTRPAPDEAPEPLRLDDGTVVAEVSPGGASAPRQTLDPATALADYEQLRALAVEVARRDPELAATVVRGWLAEDAVTKPEKEAA